MADFRKAVFDLSEPVETLADLGTCPFCGLGIRYVRNKESAEVGLGHKMPMCQTFERLDPVSFLRAARTERERQSAAPKPKGRIN